MKLQIKKPVILFSSLLFIASIQGIAFAAKATSAKTNPCKEVGAVDMNAYCTKKIPGSKAELKGQVWRCVEKEAAKGKIPYSSDIDMDEACKMQYGSTVKAYLGKAKDPYSWHCIQCK